jgi:hypothetical protein
MPLDRRLFALAALVAASPVLQGAGCSTHYSARLRGALAIDPALAAERAGKEIRVVYRNRDAATKVCEEDWAPCLSGEGWQPLGACDARQNSEGHTPTAKVAADGAAQDFDACTKMIGIDYQADIAAFIDADGDGKPSSGEIYGVYADSPLTREAEATALPLEIKLDKTMP